MNVDLVKLLGQKLKGELPIAKNKYPFPPLCELHTWNIIHLIIYRGTVPKGAMCATGVISKGAQAGQSPLAKMFAYSWGNPQHLCIDYASHALCCIAMINFLTATWLLRPF